MKKDDLSVPKIIKNNLHMMSMVCHTDAGYVLFTLFIRLLSGIRSSFLYVYLLGFVLYGIENGKGLTSVLLFLLFSVILLGSAFAIESYYDHIFKPIHRERIVSRLQYGLFDQLERADMANYDLADSYTTVTLASEEIATRPLDVTENFFRGFECLIATGTILAGAISASWLVPVICLISFATGIFITNIQSKRVVEYNEQMKRKGKKLTLLRRLLYLPEYAKDNRLSHVHHAFLTDYKATIEDKEKIAADSGRRIARLTFFQNVFCGAFCIDFLIPLTLSSIVLVYGKLSVSEFVIAINASAQVQRRLEEVTDILSDFLKNGRFVERIRRVEQLQHGIENTVGNCPVGPMENLSLCHVSFCYPDGIPGLSDVSLTIPRGSKVAIVGGNGSGKSTLIKLLLRFYDPASGEILQNGVDIRSFEISSYREQFSAVFQDFNHYVTSIRNNVCMGGKIDEDKIIFSLDEAGFSEKPDDLDTPLTRELDDNGVLFSGGQLQRLILARAFYRDSDIVILDEPTAAMDVFFEREFYRTVFENLKEKTVVLVSHRLSSITACDKILYMEHGRILEEGTHDQLMELRGGYYKLFNAQFG